MSRAIRLGVATSLGGRYALFGRQVAEALRCYVRDANSAAGIRLESEKPRPVELLCEDDASGPQVLRERVRKLIREDRVDLLFGPYGSGLTLAAAEVASAFGIVLWNHGGASDEIHARHPGSCVGVLSPASTYLVAVLEMMEAVAPPVRRIALFQAQTGFAAEVARGVSAWAARRRCEVLRRAYTPGDVGAVGDAVGELASAPSDVVLGVGRFEDDLALAEALCRGRPKTRAVALVGAGIDRFRDALGERAEGFLAPSQWEPQAQIAVDFGPTAAAFAASYRSGTSVALDYPAAQAYAAALIAQWCAERAPSLAAGALREAARRARLTTFYGGFAIDSQTGRQIGHEILVSQWRGERREILWPRQMAHDAAGLAPIPWH